MTKSSFSTPGISQASRVSVGGRRNRVVRNQDCAKRALAASAERAAQLRKMNLHQREQFLQAEHSVTAPIPDFNDDWINNDTDFSTIIPPLARKVLQSAMVVGRWSFTRSWAMSYHANEFALMIVTVMTIQLGLHFCYQNPSLANLNTSTAVLEDTFSINIVDIFEQQQGVFSHCSPHINVSLMTHGCIGSSPLQPTVAITIRTLEAYRQTHRVCPRLSIHAEAKKLCHLHGYVENDGNEYSQRVSLRVSQVLGHTGPNWHAHNSCPCCNYKVQDEPELRFPFEIALDGNNSVKFVDPALCGGRERLDPRNGQSDIWIDEEYVDRFKDENEAEDSNEPVNVCVDQWRNAAPEARKRMFSVFRKSGIFVAVCRHGFLLSICDMVHSGELMKYPLAIINKLIDVFAEPFLYGYDIKCAFHSVLQCSSLGPAVRDLGIEGVMPGFHGHAHNRLCQVQHHSKFTLSAGKEDFETCERTFLESNALVPEIWNSTEFHRHQALDEHFQFADQDKYAALSTFIYRNYMQALEYIQADNEFLLLFDLTPEHFESDLNDECDYLQKASQRRPGDSVEVEYTKALNELDVVRSQWETAQHEFNRLDLRTIPDGFTNNDIANIRCRHTTTQSKMEMKSQVVDDFETRMGIEERWMMTHPECVKAQSHIANVQYHKAVDDVECLVVMRLLELTKLQMSSLGYKLCTQIAKALKTRATAIWNALNRYNKYAGQLGPPRPPITWEQASAKYFDLQRSKEEIDIPRGILQGDVSEGDVDDDVHDDPDVFELAVTTVKFLSAT
ncbi:hypothetical protein C8R48DRAFT_760270 [Suillus tomentosus]|nr:hypothetical protein C8R48DRAFT_760270 [Suillus tomentosus]